MTAAAKEGGAWLWEVLSRSSWLLSTSLPSCFSSLLSPPLLPPLLFFFSPPLLTYFLFPFLSISLHPASPPLLPLPIFCFSQCGAHPHCHPLSSELGTGVQGPELSPKVPSESKYLLLCLHTKIKTLILWGESHCPLCLWKVRPALARSGRPQWQRPQCRHRGPLVVHTKHPAWPLSFRSRNPPQRASHRSFSNP